MIGAEILTEAFFLVRQTGIITKADPIPPRHAVERGLGGEVK
jgi:hypothetical protein